MAAATTQSALNQLQQIPGVGPSICADLRRLGIEKVADLKGRDPQQLYQRLMRKEGRHVDRCVLYVFRCAVYYATSRNPDPDKLLWWNWKDSARIQSRGRRKRGGARWRGSKRSRKKRLRAS